MILIKKLSKCHIIFPFMGVFSYAKFGMLIWEIDCYDEKYWYSCIWYKDTNFSSVISCASMNYMLYLFNWIYSIQTFQSKSFKGFFRALQKPYHHACFDSLLLSIFAFIEHSLESDIALRTRSRIDIYSAYQQRSLS